jgi:tetratricopeptide (TPR) repeat protein
MPKSSKSSLVGIYLAVSLSMGLTVLSNLEYSFAATPQTAIASTDQEKQAKIFFERGNQKFWSKNFKGAIVDYTRAIELNPKFYQAYNARGKVNSAIGLRSSPMTGGEIKHQAAIADYTEAIKLNPDYEEAYNNRGKTRKDWSSDSKGAIADFTEVIRLNPTSANAYFNRGSVRWRREGDKKGGIDDFDTALRLNPNYAEIYETRANVKLWQKDLEGAISDYTEFIRFAPRNAGAYFSRGRIYADLLGEPQKALADFQQAAKLYEQKGQKQDLQYVLKLIQYLEPKTNLVP